jgi:hypothetical protein
MQFLARPDSVRAWDVPEANRALCVAPGLENGTGIDDKVYFGNVPL